MASPVQHDLGQRGDRLFIRIESTVGNRKFCNELSGDLAAVSAWDLTLQKKGREPDHFHFWATMAVTEFSPLDDRGYDDPTPISSVRVDVVGGRTWIVYIVGVILLVRFVSDAFSLNEIAVKAVVPSLPDRA